MKPRSLILIFTLAFSSLALAQPTGKNGGILNITDAEGKVVKDVYVRVYAVGPPVVTEDERQGYEIFGQVRETPALWELRLNPMREYKSKYLITVTAPGFVTVYREVSFRGYYTEDIKLERLDPKKSFTVTGTATDDEGRIVPRAIIGVNPLGGRPTTIKVLVDENGRYRVRVALGKYMFACGRGGVRGQAYRIENQVGGSVTKADCRLTSPQRVAGTKNASKDKWDGLIYFDGQAIDRFGEEVLDVTVTLTPLDKSLAAADKKDIVMKVLGGRFGERIKPGDYRLRITAPGYVPYVVERYRVPAAINSPYQTLHVVLEAKLPGGKPGKK